MAENLPGRDAYEMAVDNALDACEEAAILLEISVLVLQKEGGVFHVIVEDNGPGIVEQQPPSARAL